MIDFASTFKIAVKSLKINKMRSILTSLGIIIGVSAVIIMLGIGEGANKRITAQFSSMGSNVITVNSGSKTSGGLRMGMGTQPTLTIKDADAIFKQCDSVANVSPLVNEAKQVTFGNQNWSTSIAGIYPSYLEIRDWSLTQKSRNFSEDDLKNANKVAILGNSVVKNLFGDLEPLNRTIRIAGVPFRVVGTLETKGEGGMGRDQDDIIMIPITTAQKKVFGSAFPGMVKSIEIKVISPEEISNAEKQVTELLVQRHHIGKNQDNDFTIRNMTQIMESVKESSKVMSILLGSIASVSLLVGGIGIMNIMLVSVTERTKEIGIRMAIGAKAMDIRLQFLVEALLLSGIGGLIGVLTGVLGALLVGKFADMSIVITMTSIVLSMSFAVLIGIIFGYYPAHKASLLNPIEALRYE